MSQYRLGFIRHQQRRVSDGTLLEGLEFIASKALGGHRGPGWTYQLGSIKVEDHGRERGYTFRSWIDFLRKNPSELLNPTPEQEERNNQRLREIIEHARQAGLAGRFASNPWIAEVDSDGSAAPADLSDDAPKVELSKVGKISRGEFFNHLYGLDSQINIMLSAIEAARQSRMSNRFHVICWGPPGSGKTDSLRAAAKMLESLRVAHLLIDATSATEAGMKKKLLADDIIPPEVLFLEEIEKVPEGSLRYLLGLMDSRAEIQKINFRVEESRTMPLLVIATANDMKQLKSMMYGALHSRFAHEVYYPRPGRETLKKILAREVAKVESAKTTWIEPTLEYCFDKRKQTDPRKLINICLSGGDALLSREYQKDLERTSPPEGKVPGGVTLSELE